MSRVTLGSRRLAAAVAGLAAACALALPAAAAHAAAGAYTPSPNEWWMAQWKVPQEVWPQTEGAGVTVGVVDTGVEASLGDLRGVVVPGGDTAGESGDGEKDYAPGDGHGTAVAVMIAGQGSGVGIVGIAPQAKILPVHALYPSTNATPTAIAQGIKYAVDHGAKVINLSIGNPVGSATTCDPAEQDAVAYALAHNVVVVAASGDTNKGVTVALEPATCAGVFTVGAVEPNGSLWPDSTQGPDVSVAAPGDQMTFEGADGRHSTDASGTSLAAPLVSGAAALIRSKNPSMPWYTVVQRLIGTAIAAPPGSPVPNNGAGYGIIDVNRAVNASHYPVSASAPNPVYARYQAWLKTPNGQAFARANGIGTGQSGSGASGGQPAPSATAKSSSGSSTLLIVLVVVLVVAIGGGIALVQRTRNRIRRGPRNPGGGGGFPPGGYGPPPGQQYPQGRQYPPGR